MIRIFVPLIFILGLISCKSTIESNDYLGQNYPDSIPVIFAPNIISMKGRLEHGISFSPDTNEVALGILNKDYSGKIFYAEKLNENWTEPKIFKPLENKCVYLPYFSPNGKSLLYAQSKLDDNYFSNIWLLEKTDDNWSAPNFVKAPFSSNSREANASMTNDGTIYFSSNRNCEGKENCFGADLFYSKINNDEFESAELISEFVSANDEESVFISPNEEYIIFCRYTDNETKADLYISFRGKNKKWSEPNIIDSAINSEDWDRRPFVSTDNKFLFFTRLQIEENEILESDIYWVNTSKIFKPFVYNARPDKILQVGEEFELSIPTDYFKDIDDEKLTLSIDQTEFDWLEFDSDNLKLSGSPTEEGDFKLTFTAVDAFSNSTEHQIKLTVVK